MSNVKCKKLIAGLGNPGKKYEKTRHNLGFMVIDTLIAQLRIADYALETNNKFKARIIKISYNSQLAIRNPTILLTKPQTYMNNSGLAVAKIANFYKIKPQDIWVIYDDIDLKLGVLRIRHKGSSGGHKGVQSVIDSLGSSDFMRFRLGIGPVPDKIDPADFVLQKFAKDEMAIAQNMIKKAVSALLHNF